MRLIGLLNWFDEPVTNLAACVESLGRAGVDHLVAVDGRYALYPGEGHLSHVNQTAAIVLACEQIGMGLTLHRPAGIWQGNEVEKRTAMFQLAWAEAEPGDWFFVMDADQVVVKYPPDLKDILDASELDAGEVRFLDTVALAAQDPQWPPEFEIRCLFRAQSIHVKTHHSNYMTADGRLLWGWDKAAALEPALELAPHLLVEHRPDRRPPERQQAKMTYYVSRDDSRIERGPCGTCERPSAGLVATRWRRSKIGPVADWQEACEKCAVRFRAAGRRQLLQMGVDPDKARIENRNGKAPRGVAQRTAAP